MFTRPSSSFSPLFEVSDFMDTVLRAESEGGKEIIIPRFSDLEDKESTHSTLSSSNESMVSLPSLQVTSVDQSDVERILSHPKSHQIFSFAAKNCLIPPVWSFEEEGKELGTFSSAKMDEFFSTKRFHDETVIIMILGPESSRWTLQAIVKRYYKRAVKGGVSPLPLLSKPQFQSESKILLLDFLTRKGEAKEKAVCPIPPSLAFFTEEMNQNPREASQEHEDFPRRRRVYSQADTTHRPLILSFEL